MDWRTSPLIATWWGERRDPLRALLRLPLVPFAAIATVAADVRAAAYARGWISKLRLAVPTISVGNLTVGGTGKSPTVRFLARRLVAAGHRPLVFSSGFGARPDGARLDEEGAALARAVPEAVVLQSREPRTALPGAFGGAGQRPDVVILDDGFQKLGVARDLDIVMLDATRPFGSGFVVPAGPLRERRRSLERAGIVVLSRTDLVPPDRVLALERDVSALAPRALLLRQRHEATVLLFTGAPASSLRGRRVHLLSAIGHPRAFDATVAACGAVIAGHSAFRDHAPLPHRVLAAVVALARKQGAELVVCTAKDAPKLGDVRGFDVPIDALDVDVVFEGDTGALDARISSLFDPELHAITTQRA